jgi:hypothetical protein
MSIPMILIQSLQWARSTHDLDPLMPFTHRDEPNIALQGIVWLIKISARLQDCHSNRIYRGLGARVSCDMLFSVLAST